MASCPLHFIPANVGGNFNNTTLMRYFTWILIVYFCGFNYACNNSFNRDKKFSSSDSIININRVDSNDSIFKAEILNANKRFKISDSIAVKLIRQVKDLKEIIDWKDKNDSTYNIFDIDCIPNGTDPNWIFAIRQEQPNIEHSVTIMRIQVNAYNGTIMIEEMFNDTLFTVDAWQKRKCK